MSIRHWLFRGGQRLRGRDSNHRTSRCLPRLEQLEPRTVPSTAVTPLIAAPGSPSAATAFGGVLIIDPSLQSKVSIGPTSSVVLSGQAFLTFRVSFDSAASLSFAMSATGPADSAALQTVITFTIGSTGVVNSSVPGGSSTIPAGSSSGPSQVLQFPQKDPAAQHAADYVLAIDATSLSGLTVMVSASSSSSSSMATSTLAITTVTTSAGQVGIILVVASGTSVDARIIWLVAAQSGAAAPQPSQTGSYSGSLFVASPELKSFRPDAATHEQLTIGPLAFEVAADSAAPLVTLVSMGELLRRARTPAAYIGWSGRDNPSLTLGLAAGAKPATSLEAGTKAAAVRLAYASPHRHRPEPEAEINTLPVDTPVMGATVGLTWDRKWLVEADPRRQILPEDASLDAPPSPQPRRSAKARAGARGLALLAIGVTATWIYGQVTAELMQPRDQARPRGRT